MWKGFCPKGPSFPLETGAQGPQDSVLLVSMRLDFTPLGWAALAVCCCLGFTGCNRKSQSISTSSGQKAPAETYVPRPTNSITFNKDIAPIVFQNCSGCHRPGQSGPFPLLSYADVKKRDRQIGEVTQKGFMPPWLPDLSVMHLVGERKLSVDQVGLIQQWVAEGAAEGVASDLPALPRWNDDWLLGKPDLVVTAQEPYVLHADGTDIYRNIVIPVPLSAGKFVEGIEFRGGSKSIHHAFIRMDRTGQARRLEKKDGQPGFDGMDVPNGVEAPGGYFLSWQPGKVPSRAPKGLAWKLEPGTDLVLQIHMRPLGKRETITPSVAFYFTDTPPTNTPSKISLSSMAIDIPAGSTDSVVEDSYVLPVDVQLLAVNPHTHYLGRELEGFATLPDGSRQWLLHIPNWDFNWQGDYQLAEPLLLPRGTKVQMRYRFDNSTNNFHNPNSPPKRVLYGTQSSDEMAELWLQVLPRNREDLATLVRDHAMKLTRSIVSFNEYRLGLNPNDAKAHNKLGQALLSMNKSDEAYDHLRKAAELDSTLDEPHYFLGIIFRSHHNNPQAKVAFETTLRLNPNQPKAHGNLGFVLLELKDLAGAQKHFQAALKANPEDDVALSGMGFVAYEQGDLDMAIAQFQEAVRLNSNDPELKRNLATVIAARNQGRRK
jgi:tetratricopeptide (TPR) repeat protein